MYRVLHTIKEAKACSDFVMIVMHGGNEYNPIPSHHVVHDTRYRNYN